MKKILSLLILLCIVTVQVNAQTYYKVTHTTGTQTVNNTNVTVSAVNNATTYGTYCGAGPYWIGQQVNTANGYTFSFSSPVAKVRFEMTATGGGEVMSFSVNSSTYSITNGNISSFPGTCSCPYNPLITSGKLTVNTTTTAFNGGTTVDIGGVSGGISNITVMNSGAAGGTVFSFYFTADTTVFIDPPFNDTLLCAGDTMTINYDVSTKFNSNNTFTAQLSDKNGSFSSPATIGTINSDTSGTFKWVVPNNITPGTGYRVRVVGSSPSRTSADNGTNIVIGNVVPAKPVASSNSPVCTGDTLKLSAYSSTNGVSYKWTGPNSFTSAQQNPVINNPPVQASGNYIVTAWLYGCYSKDTTGVTVFNGTSPNAAVAGSNSPVCEGDTIKLTGVSGSGVTYSWSGPSSFSSSSQNPVIANSTAANAGDYILTAASGNCVKKDTVNVQIKPTPYFTASSNSPVCTDGLLSFSASSSVSGVSYSWSGPNGFTSNASSPGITGVVNAHAGTYYVSASLNGCYQYDTLQVAVKPSPVKPVAGADQTICERDTINLTGSTTTTGVTYSWTGPASYTSSTQHPVITNTTPAMSGNYIVSADLNGCAKTDTTVVTVKPSPAIVSAGSNTPLCTGDSLELQCGTSSTGVSYSWSGPNSFTDNNQNTGIGTVSLAAKGWYVVTLDLNGCIFKDSVNVVVNQLPSTPTASYTSPVCVGETLQLYASTVTGATYSWSGPNSYSTAVQNPNRINLATNDTGTYSVTATVNGCTSPAGKVKVAINPVPFVVIFPNDDSICQGEPGVFTALANNAGGTPQYKWFINAQYTGNTGANFSTTSLNDGDIVHCDMTENTKCSVPYTDASNDVKMNVLPWLAPSVSIVADKTGPLAANEYIKFTATPVNAGKKPTYQWKRNGKDVIGATGETWSANTLNDNDTVCVEVISNYSCPQPKTALSNCIGVHVMTSVNDVNSTGNIALYPNPNNGKFILKGRLETIGKTEIRVANTIGQTLYREVIDCKSHQLVKEIDVHILPEGVYILRLGDQAIRFIKE